LDTRGELTDEGAKRIERAMVAMLLGPDQGLVLDSLFNRSGTLGLRAILGGVASETGSLLKLAGAKPDFDLSPVLASALKTAVEAKQAVANGQFRDVSEFFDQGSLFESTDNTPERQLARAIVESRSRKAVREILAAYRKGADAVDTSTMSMFAEEETTRESLILKALEARPVEQVVAEIEAEFGKSSDLAAKLRVGVPAIKKLDAGQRREFMAGVNAEVDRLRAGVMSAEEWQRLNPDALGAKEALFQRFLDSHTAETIAGGFNRLLSPKVQGVLGSSEETSAPREHLGIPRTDMPQIRIDVRGKFRRWMEAEGIRVSIEEINPNTLTPSQADLWDTAIKGAHKHTRTRNVIVSADGYILDGHHQWKAAQEKGKTKLPVVVIGLPAREALAKMHEFGKVDHSALPGTRYENEEYMYGGKAPEDWRKSNLPEASIVNPINPDLSPDAKTEALIDLASQNVPLVEQILANLRSNVGVEGKYSIKLPERIQGKASRPSIRDEAPWHDIEHVRDGLRFKVTLTHFNQIEGIVQEFANAGIEIIKFDTKKMFAPKEFGWRFIGFDMRMPNGQLVEFYAPLGTMDQKSVKEPNHLLFEKWRNVPKHVWLNDPALAAERAADVRESRDRYDAAFMEGIEAMGLTYAEAEALFNNLVSAAESVISSQSDMGPLRAPSVQMSGLESRQTDSPARMMSARPSPGNRSFDPRAEAYAKGLVEGFEVEDTADKDGEITTTNTKFGSGNQGNSGSSLGSSADSGFDLFGEIEPSILGPRAKVKRNALAAIKAQPAGSTAQTNIAKQIGKREGMADLDLFAAASVRSLDAKPKKSESVPDDSDQGQSGNPLNPRLYGGQPTKGTRGTRGVGADQDLFDFSGRPSGATGNQDGGPASPDVQGTQAGVSGSGDGSAATSSDIGGRGPGTGRPAGSNEGVRPDSGNAGKRRLSERQRPPLNSPERNFTIGKNTVLAEGGAITRLRNNLAAIDILRQLEKEGRNATVEEKAAMAKYVGWGGIPQVFDEGKARAIADGEIETRRETAERYKRNYPGRYTEEIERQETRANDLEKWQEKWGEHYTRLESLLTPEEWESARDSTINAHYTSPTVINGMWDAVKRFGFEGGNVLEPAGGVGHYFGLMPPSMVGKSRLFGVELDSISGRIFGKLYPEADIEVTGFQDSTLPENSQDLVISNVPFANITVSDAFLDAQPGAPKFNLHNYFFEKALRMTRPGGIVAFITTANTMDSQITQRKWLAERADFLGAIRLPNDAFKANANTQVVTDIIFLRKPDGSPNPMAEEQWSSTRTVGLEGGGSIEVNEYFARHPEMILGRLADDGSMYGGRKEMTVHSTGDLAEQLRAAVDRLPENVVGEGQADAIERLSTANRGAKDGAFIEEDGKIRIKGDNDPVPVKELGKVRAFMNLRDTLNDLYDMESDPGATDAQIAAQRSALNRAYDGFKSVYKILHDPKNKRLLETDPDFYRTLGLEVPVGEKKILRQQEFRKADVFSKRVLEPRVAPESAENIDDALIHSFRWKGRLDARYIGKLLGITVDEAETRLLGTEHAYRDPSTGKVEHATNYLAGNVRKKLRDAEFAAQKDPSMRRNVEGLRAALPEDVGWADINFKMGSSWIPAEMYERFLSEKLFDGRRKATVIYNKGVGDLITDSFMVQQDSTGYPSAIDTQWGTRRKSATEIAEALLNQRDPRVTKTVDGKPVYDAEATDMARAAASRMADAFQEWVAANTEVQESLHRIYNESFNSHVIPKYDGSFMQLPWVASDFDLYSEKKHVVWRALQEGTLLVAHGVGGGKTIIGTAIAMETRRLGLAKKPLIVVHNATLEQFATTITQMAPTARVLVARKEDLAGPKRKEFMGRVRSGDWDAVIMAHSTFDLIPDDPAWERQQINDLIGELEDAIREQGGDPAQNDLKKIKDPSVKELVKMRTRLKDRMSKLQERRVDDVLNFQELGIDAMIVDEVHRYKKQPFVTRQSNIAGIDTSFSKRGSAMQLRAKWVQAINQGRGVFTMTGTPVTNTLGESWNMVRLVRPDLLKEFGVQTFDRFVSVFGNIKQSGELRPNGRYKPVTRLS
jgi:N12 class adenine-specific DNA methylase